MINWKFWQRTNTEVDPDLPPEVQEYYESTRRGRKSVAVLLGIATVIITLLVAAILYYGGRFVWNKFADNDSQPETTQEQTPVQQPASTPTPDPAPTTLPGSEESDQQSRSGTSSTRTENETTTKTPRRSTAPESTPDTGPGEVFAVAAGVMLASGLAYEIVPRVKSRR